jgi:hypothetical protein
MDFMSEKVSDELLDKIGELVSFLTLLSTVYAVAGSIEHGRGDEWRGNSLIALANLTEAVLAGIIGEYGDNDPRELTQGQAYELLFRAGDARGVVLEISNRTDELTGFSVEAMSGKSVAQKYEETITF